MLTGGVKLIICIFAAVIFTSRSPTEREQLEIKFFIMENFNFGRVLLGAASVCGIIFAVRASDEQFESFSQWCRNAGRKLIKGLTNGVEQR